MFPRLYDDAKCPLAGYEGLTFRVLLNPTANERLDWAYGTLGTPDCAACVTLPQTADDARAYCPDCTLSRDRLARGALAVFGTSAVAGFDFSTAEAALASLDQDDLPDELLTWLWLIPGTLWSARTDDLKKKLAISLTTPA